MIFFVNHPVHASYLRDQGVVAREGPLKEEAVATAAAVVRRCCLSISPKPPKIESELCMMQCGGGIDYENKILWL